MGVFVGWAVLEAAGTAGNGALRNAAWAGVNSPVAALTAQRYLAAPCWWWDKDREHRGEQTGATGEAGTGVSLLTAPLAAGSCCSSG